MIETVATLRQTLRYSKGAVTDRVISGWDIWEHWDRGPQQVIRFTTSHMVVRETITYYQYNRVMQMLCQMIIGKLG